jgi:hypothetical protein
MKKSVMYFIICVFLLFGKMPVSAVAIKQSLSIQDSVFVMDISPDYVFALNAADRFLHAWLMGDYKDGMQFTSDDLKKNVSQEDLNIFFSGKSTPNHLAYEVVGWSYVDENTIKFHIWLYEYITAPSINPIDQPEPFYIEVVRGEKDSWFVNTLPMRENYYKGADNI